MLVCNVSMRPRRHEVAAELIEAGAAEDVPGGQLAFATIIDDPAAGNDVVDAFLGEIMREAANANDLLDEGYNATLSDALNATSVEDATIPPAITTWNPADLSGITLSGGNLVATSTAGNSGVRGTNNRSSGKSYWEYTYTTINTNGLDVGIALSTYNLTSGTSTNAAFVLRSNGAILINGANVGTPLGIIQPNNKIGVAVDFTAQLIWFRIAPSGSWNGSGTADPATGAGGLSISGLSGAKFPLFIGGSGDVCTANFGATAFTGAVPSGFNSGF